MNTPVSRRGFLKNLLTAAVAAPVIYSFPKILVPQNIGLISMIDDSTYANNYFPASAWRRALEFEIKRLKESFFEEYGYSGPLTFLEEDGAVLRKEDDGVYSAILRGEHGSSGAKVGETAWGKIVVQMPTAFASGR